MKRPVSLILSALLLSAALIGCGESTAPTSVETQAQPSGENATETETEPARPAVNLPDTLDFGEAEFRAAAIPWQGYAYYFFSDGENGDVMNDALYHRNQAVEERLNVRLTYDMLDPGSTESVPNAIRQMVMAGEDTYQMALLHCIGGVSTSVTRGLFYNLDTLPYIDMKADWWNQEQMNVLRLGQNTYYAVNDFMIPCPYIIYFNKQMVQNLDMENPYQLVYDGKWTLDRFLSMASEVKTDLNGDGKMNFENDIYGITAIETSKYISFLPACGQFLTEKGADGRISLAINTEKTQTIITKFKDIADNNVCYLPPSQSGSVQLTVNSGRLLFQLDALSRAEIMRDYEVDFGFLPYPKFDEAQERYYSMDWGGLLAVPTTIRDPEMVGAVLEMLAYENGNEVIPTYYSTVLTGKLARDEDAEKMLNIIFDTICYEAGGNYFGFTGGFQNLFYAISNLSLAKKNDFSSYYAKNEKSALTTIEKFYASLETIENAD